MYHIPVLLEESLRSLNINKNGVYADLTFGGGGHSRAILNLLTAKGHLFAFDQDEDSITNAKKMDAENFSFFKSNACYLQYFLSFYGYSQIDGIIVDLGISSHQIDTPTRGFSTRYSGPLDMRMNKSITLTAHTVINKYSEKQLYRIFNDYGEIANATALASAVIKHRRVNAIDTTNHLCEILEKLVSKNKLNKYSAKAFQAIRIEVNKEIDVLKKILLQIPNLLKPGGRLVVISYHSLEDRLVKRFINTGNFTSTSEKDIYGNVSKPLKSIYTKPLKTSEKELQCNSRSRSARLRVAEKV